MTRGSGTFAPWAARRPLIWRTLRPRTWKGCLALALVAAVVIHLAYGQIEARLDTEERRTEACKRDAGGATSLEEGAPTVTYAYHLLLVCYAEPPDGAALLQAAWGAIRNEGVALGEASSVPEPRLEGSRFLYPYSFTRSFAALLHERGGAVSRDDLTEKAVRAMVASLHDDHTPYIPKDQMSFSGSNADLGISLVFAPDGLLVWEVVGDNAVQAGLRPGDIVTAINGKPAPKGLTSATQLDALDPLVYGFTPTKGATAQLSVKRAGSPDLRLALKMGEQRPLLTTKSFSGIGYVRLQTFFLRLREYSGTYLPRVEDLAKEKPQAWILDLRNNPGGSLLIGTHVLHTFGYNGELASYSRDIFSEADTKAKDLVHGKPLVVLINGLSGSASELVAADLQERGLAHVIGEQSAGAVGGASIFYIGKAGLEITTTRAYTSLRHRDLDGTGVSPDEVVHLTPEELSAGKDAQLDRALDYLHVRQASKR